MIPKIIHYIWFGDKPLDNVAKKCLKSWKKYCPDYKLILWNEKNFDVNMFQYTKEAFLTKSWAFLSDVVRLYALVNYGGVYMDTDVQITKPIDDFLDKRAFSGFEDQKNIPTGIMACEKGFPLFEKLLNDYKSRSLIRKDGSIDRTTNVQTITKTLLQYGFVPNNQYQVIEGFELFPNDYFCPKDHNTLKICKTQNTHTIHHFNASWCTKKERFIRKIGPKWTRILVSIKHIFRRKHE